MSATLKEKSNQWYAANRSIYESLGNVVKSICETLLKKRDIDYLSVNSRAKTLESFSEKIDRKGYTDPKVEMTDLAGIRIITFIEKDAISACEFIKELFDVHSNLSLDKSTELGHNQFGYRSFHFVCCLGKERVKLPEFSFFKDLFFEIQIRTVLQHAWAEIEHDRNYKLAGDLPIPLKRRLYLIAGMLEIADREFNSVALDLDNYGREVAATTKKGDLNIDINSTSVTEFLKNKYSHLTTEDSDQTGFALAVEELRSYGLKTLQDLDHILNNRFLNLYTQFEQTGRYRGFIRAAMMADDLEKYLSQSWDYHFGALTLSAYNFLKEIYGSEKLDKLIKGKLVREDEYFGMKPEERTAFRASIHQKKDYIKKKPTENKIDKTP